LKQKSPVNKKYVIAEASSKSVYRWISAYSYFDDFNKKLGKIKKNVYYIYDVKAPVEEQIILE